jgi:hypothetical protein
MGAETLEVLADRGCFSGEEILACEVLGATPYVPKPLTSGAKAGGSTSRTLVLIHVASFAPHQPPPIATRSWIVSW